MILFLESEKWSQFSNKNHPLPKPFTFFGVIINWGLSLRDWIFFQVHINNGLSTTQGFPTAAQSEVERWPSHTSTNCDRRSLSQKWVKIQDVWQSLCFGSFLKDGILHGFRRRSCWKGSVKIIPAKLRDLIFGITAGEFWEENPSIAWDKINWIPQGCVTWVHSITHCSSVKSWSKPHQSGLHTAHSSFISENPSAQASMVQSVITSRVNLWKTVRVVGSPNYLKVPSYYASEFLDSKNMVPKPRNRLFQPSEKQKISSKPF